VARPKARILGATTAASVTVVDANRSVWEHGGADRRSWSLPGLLRPWL